MIPKELKNYKYSKSGILWSNIILIFYIILDTLWGIHVVKANVSEVNGLFIFSTMGITLILLIIYFHYCFHETFSTPQRIKITKITYWSSREGKYLITFRVYFELYKFKSKYNIFKIKKIYWEMYTDFTTENEAMQAIRLWLLNQKVEKHPTTEEEIVILNVEEELKKLDENN